LQRIFDLAVGTGGLDRLVIFGNYVIDKSEPADVDVILIMRDDFERTRCTGEASALF